MPALREVQAAFRAALLGGTAERREPGGAGADGLARPDVAGAVVPDGLDPAARLAVYRHHVLASLTAALETTYPVVAGLVDPRFFRYAADAYIRHSPPDGPCLFEYGGTFPDFLARFPATRSLAWLPDVARLEWAMNVALHAPDVPRLEPEALRALPPVRLHPSVTLLRSAWPVDAIWRAQRPPAVRHGAVDGAAAVVVQVWRDGDEEVVFRALGPAEHAFRNALGRARGLAAAAQAAVRAEPAADLAALVRGLLVERVLIAA